MNKPMFLTGLVITLINIFVWVIFGIYLVISSIEFTLYTLQIIGIAVYGIFTIFGLIMMLLGVFTEQR